MAHCHTYESTLVYLCIGTWYADFFAGATLWGHVDLSCSPLRRRTCPFLQCFFWLSYQPLILSLNSVLSNWQSVIEKLVSVGISFNENKQFWSLPLSSSSNDPRIMQTSVYENSALINYGRGHKSNGRLSWSQFKICSEQNWKSTIWFA